MAHKTNPKIDAIRAQLPKRERRFVPGADSAVEMRDDAGTPKIAMSIPFNRRSVELWGFTEVIEPGAFRKTLQEADVVCLWQHDPSWVLGRMSNKTLEARETDTALEGVVALDAEDPMHKHFARRVERRDVVGSSFGFETVRDEWDYSDENQIIRTLKEVRLFDISPVTFPAYPDSDAQKRASSVLDIASVRAGVDIAVLAAAIAAAEDGRIPSEAAERVRSCVDKIVAMLPPPPTPQMSDDERRQRLNLFGKLAGR